MSRAKDGIANDAALFDAVERLDQATQERYAARRARAAQIHRLPERMLVDRARGESPAVRRAQRAATPAREAV